MTLTAGRALLFLAGCLGARAALAYATYSARDPRWVRALAAAALAIAAGFFVIYANGWRATGPETFGDPIWWDALRPLHGTLYLASGLLALRGSRLAWAPLGVDVAVGFAAFLAHHAA